MELQKQYVMAYPLIFNENTVTVVKIINEYWVTADIWIRLRQWIHDRRIKSITKNRVMADAWNCQKLYVSVDP